MRWRSKGCIMNGDHDVTLPSLATAPRVIHESCGWNKAFAQKTRWSLLSQLVVSTIMGVFAIHAILWSSKTWQKPKCHAWARLSWMFGRRVFKLGFGTESKIREIVHIRVSHTVAYSKLYNSDMCVHNIQWLTLICAYVVNTLHVMCIY